MEMIDKGQDPHAGDSSVTRRRRGRGL